MWRGPPTAPSFVHVPDGWPTTAPRRSSRSTRTDRTMQPLDDRRRTRDFKASRTILSRLVARRLEGLVLRSDAAGLSKGLGQGSVQQLSCDGPDRHRPAGGPIGRPTARSSYYHNGHIWVANRADAHQTPMEARGSGGAFRATAPLGPRRYEDRQHGVTMNADERRREPVSPTHPAAATPTGNRSSPAATCAPRGPRRCSCRSCPPTGPACRPTARTAAGCHTRRATRQPLLLLPHARHARRERRCGEFHRIGALRRLPGRGLRRS